MQIDENSTIIEHNQEPDNGAEILTPIQWVEQTKRLGDLRPFESNPRTITEAQYEKLKQSIIEDGYHSRIKATPDGRVLGGHQRLRAMRELGFKDVAVLIPDRYLTDAEFRRVLIRDNHNNGLWDMDILSAQFDLDELHEWGLHDLNNLREPDDKPGKAMVCCPECGHVFPTKGNKANA